MIVIVSLSGGTTFITDQTLQWKSLHELKLTSKNYHHSKSPTLYFRKQVSKAEAVPKLTPV